MTDTVKRAPLYALTLWQPWAWAITNAGKLVENREWPPPAYVVGRWLAIHAGKRYDTEAFEELMEVLKVPVPTKKEITLGAIVALARVTGWDRKTDTLVKEDDPWFCGPVGWRLADVTPIEPVPCNGARKLWRVEGDLLESVRAAFDAARCTKRPTLTTPTEQEAWEDAELLPDMTTDARRWFLAERKRRQKGSQDDHDSLESRAEGRCGQAQPQQEDGEAGSTSR